MRCVAASRGIHGQRRCLSGTMNVLPTGMHPHPRLVVVSPGFQETGRNFLEQVQLLNGIVIVFKNLCIINIRCLVTNLAKGLC